MNRQSNLYTVIYASVLVLAVGILLSVVYQGLRPRQLENIDNDTKRQILAAALIFPSEGKSVADLYAEHIKGAYIVNSDGQRVDDDLDPFKVKIATQVKLPADQRKLPVFECETSTGLKYVIPVYGAGLWGPIWGYVSFNAGSATIYGAYFGHEGETPGLGAEIEKPAFSSQFEGKSVLSPDGQFTSVAVVKAGHEPASGDYVHAVSGGTITSQGVQNMLYNSLEPYKAFFDNIKSSNPDNTSKS